MQIQFHVGEVPVEFGRNCFTGRTVLRVAGQTVLLASPFNPLNHFTLARKHEWRYQVDTHEVVVEKTRPLLMAGLRPQSYRVLVDGKVIAERAGY